MRRLQTFKMQSTWAAKLKLLWNMTPRSLTVRTWSIPAKDWGRLCLILRINQTFPLDFDNFREPATLVWAHVPRAWPLCPRCCDTGIHNELEGRSVERTTPLPTLTFDLALPKFNYLVPYGLWPRVLLTKFGLSWAWIGARKLFTDIYTYISTEAGEKITSHHLRCER